MKAVLLGVALAVAGAGSAGADAHSAAYVEVPLSAAAFQEIAPGVELAIVAGDPATGPVSAFIRFGPGNPGFMHVHTADYHAVVVDGAWMHWEEGQDMSEATRLEVGDGWFQAGGANHQDANPLQNAPSTIFVVFTGPLDTAPAE
ncbi:hypothetical protein HKCCE3408_09730 [Rhodobacterales bacterium HKCCE3408]|nr:hypothetical protein [Rhodobacterales bacterium HKCCE3408]